MKWAWAGLEIWHENLSMIRKVFLCLLGKSYFSKKIPFCRNLTSFPLSWGKLKLVSWTGITWATTYIFPILQSRNNESWWGRRGWNKLCFKAIHSNVPRGLVGRETLSYWVYGILLSWWNGTCTKWIKLLVFVFYIYCKCFSLLLLENYESFS